ncbi:MAG: MFS transporter, partial [Acidimicrobiales bacterium]
AVAGLRAPSVRDRCALPLVALAAGLGSGAGGALTAFLVDFGVRSAGLAQAGAGLVFALASLVSLAGRVACGWTVDRRSQLRPYSLVGVLLVAGAAGDLLIGAGTPLLFVTGALVAFGIGWAWPGLVHFTVVARDPAVAARATGVLMTGFATGSCISPLLLGQIARIFAFRTVWLAAAAANLLAAVVLTAGSARARAAAPTR